MTTLAVEFSSERRSVAIAADGQVLGEAEEIGGRTARTFSLVELALSRAQREREQIECVVIGLGPGSYAGIRAAIALAQGWQVARKVHVLGISSVECIALQAQAESVFGPVSILVDAQRNEFYHAAYEIDASRRRLLEPLRLLTREETLTRCRTGTIIVQEEWAAHFPEARVLGPKAAALAQLAAGNEDFVSGEKLEPIYLREAAFVKTPTARQIQ